MRSLKFSQTCDITNSDQRRIIQLLQIYFSTTSQYTAFCCIWQCISKEQHLPVKRRWVESNVWLRPLKPTALNNAVKTIKTEPFCIYLVFWLKHVTDCRSNFWKRLYVSIKTDRGMLIWTKMVKRQFIEYLQNIYRAATLVWLVKK